MKYGDEAIDNCLLWELCKKKGIQEEIIEGRQKEGDLKENVEETKREFQSKSYSLQEKKALLRELDSNPEYRLKIFEEHTWSKEKVNVEELGTTLPRAGDLPPEVITGPITEVVEYVKNTDPENSQSVRYIRILTNFSEVLDSFPPWVVTPGNRPEKIDRMNRVHGEKNWEIKDTWGMINDGNHRTMARILAEDPEEIECFVGRPENN